MKNIEISINEEYYNPDWFYTFDYDYYNSFVLNHIDELCNIIENQDYEKLVEFCREYDMFLPNYEYSHNSKYEYEITFNTNPATVNIYVYNTDSPGGGSIDLTIYENT